MTEETTVSAKTKDYLPSYDTMKKMLLAVMDLGPGFHTTDQIAKQLKKRTLNPSERKALKQLAHNATIVQRSAAVTSMLSRYEYSLP